MSYHSKPSHHPSQGTFLLVILLVGGFLLSGVTTPAFADSPVVTGTITSGSLSETAETSYSFTGTPGTTVTYTMPFTSSDLTGSGAGWNLSITSTTLTSSSDALPAQASTIIGTAATCTTSGMCSDPTLTNTISGIVVIPAASIAPQAVKFFGAYRATGSGTYIVTPTISVIIPGGTLVGAYTSIVTLTISSGP